MVISVPPRTAASVPTDTALAAARAECTAQLEALTVSSAAVVFASLSSADGRMFAHATTRSSILGARISALTSSLLALCHALAKEGLLGPCEYNVIAAGGGSIVLVRVPTAPRMFTLSVGADRAENVAMVLRSTLDLAHNLGRILDRSLASETNA